LPHNALQVTLSGRHITWCDSDGYLAACAM
jgi:hypothetical protein